MMEAGIDSQGHDLWGVGSGKEGFLPRKSLRGVASKKGLGPPPLPPSCLNSM